VVFGLVPVGLRGENLSMRRTVPLHWQMLIALLLALAGGAGLRALQTNWPAGHGFLMETLRVLGVLFLLLLKMVVLPLVMASLVSGMAGLGRAGKFGRVGLKTFAYYLSTTVMAVATGLVLVNVIQPGVGANLALPDAKPQMATVEKWTDLIIRIVPDNIVKAMAQFDMIGVIFFALVFGLAVNFVSEKSRATVLSFVDGVLEVMMTITHAIIRLAPVGVFALVARMIADTGVEVLRPLLPYALTVAAGLAMHFFVTLPVLVWLLARVPPYRLMRTMSEALFTAFSTASSSATLPLTMERAEKGAGVSNRIASFTLPLGATINMDGTALYECVAVIFIAQAMGVTLSVAQQATVFVGAVLVSIGAAGIPHAGLVMMSIILTSVGLPLEGAALIWAVDRLLDMCRTTVNVWSDVAGCVVIAKSEGELDATVLPTTSR
jgi:Na+/H+-dicarboxylate symporter